MAAGSDEDDAEWAGPIERDVRSVAGWDGEGEGEGTPLEDALAPLTASADQALPLRNAAGQITGQVSLSDAVKALHS